MSRDEEFRVEPVPPERSPLLGGTGMSRDETFSRCIAAFAAGDYEDSVELAWSLVEDEATLHTLQLLFIALQRLGREKELEEIGTRVLDAMDSRPWEQALLRLTLGQVHPKDVLNHAADNRQVCQVTYYAGARLLTYSTPDRARYGLEQCVASGCDCLERQLAHYELERLGQTSQQTGNVNWEERINKLCEEAVRLHQQGNFAKETVVGKQALALAREHLGANPSAFATTLITLVALYWDLGESDQTAPWLLRELAMARDALPVNHPNIAIRLNNRGLMCESSGDWAKAELLFRQSLKILSAGGRDNHADFVTVLNHLGQVCKKTADYPRAETAFRQAEEISRTGLGSTHPGFATSLHNLGALYMEMADFRRAESLLRHAWQATSTIFGEDHPNTVACMVNWASVLMNIGDNTIAEPLLQRALEVWRDRPDNDPRGLGQILHHLAVLHANNGDLSRAEALFLQAIEVRRAHLGENDPHFAESLVTLAMMYCLKREYSSAEPLLHQALEVRRRTLPADHPQFAESLSVLGAMYVTLGNYDKAEPFLRQALRIKHASLGESHPELAVSLFHLAMLCAATNRTHEALGLLRQTLEIGDCQISQLVSFGGEHQLAVYLAQDRNSLEPILSLVWRFLGDSPEAIATLLDVVLRRKGIRAEVDAFRRRAISLGANSECRSMMDELDKLDAMIARKALAGPGSEPPDAHLHQLNKWIVERNTFDQGLARKVGDLLLNERLTMPDRHDVAQALPEGSVLIEFVRFTVLDFLAVPTEGRWKPPRYLALVLLADEPNNVVMIDLGQAEVIDRLIDDFRASVALDPQDRLHRDVLRRGPEVRPDASGRAGVDLRAAIFDKLVAAFQGRTRLFLAPDGALTRLPFEVLPGPDGTVLLEQYQVSYLGSGRDAMHFGVPTRAHHTAPLVIADPLFDLDVAGNSANRRSGYEFRRLPDSREEGKAVADLLGVEPWLGGDALEGRLKQVRSPRVLHLATHGFFLQDQGNERDAGAMDWLVAREGSGRFSGPLVQQNPLLRSGLALAGAQTWLDGGALPPEAEDGLLTAQDVQGLDLLGTELAVLSACDTGLGAVQVGEGVFGLRRAFTVAGARTLVMSLWKVPGEQTSQFMVLFYRKLLKGKTKVDALRETQLAMKEEYPHPFFWGAFILQGDPGPLSQSIMAH